jgi:hypothetical protein
MIASPGEAWSIACWSARPFAAISEVTATAICRPVMGVDERLVSTLRTGNVGVEESLRACAAVGPSRIHMMIAEYFMHFLYRRKMWRGASVLQSGMVGIFRDLDSSGKFYEATNE